MSHWVSHSEADMRSDRWHHFQAERNSGWQNSIGCAVGSLLEVESHHVAGSLLCLEIILVHSDLPALPLSRSADRHKNSRLAPAQLLLVAVEVAAEKRTQQASL